MSWRHSSKAEIVDWIVSEVGAGPDSRVSCFALAEEKSSRRLELDASIVAAWGCWFELEVDCGHARRGSE